MFSLYSITSDNSQQSSELKPYEKIDSSLVTYLGESIYHTTLNNFIIWCHSLRKKNVNGLPGLTMLKY